MKINSFSTLYGILFSIVGIIVGIWISIIGISDDYTYFYIYSGIAGYITGKLFAYYIIQRKNRYNHQNYILVGILTGTISHWLCWYFILLELNVGYWILGENYSAAPMNLLSGIFGVFIFCFGSWIFAGWATILGGITSIYAARKIFKK